MKKQYTAAEKAEYYAQLRAKWSEVKALAGTDDMQRVYMASGATVSAKGWTWVYNQMQEQGMDGWPVVDALTFQGWKAAGFTVRKGEKSTLSGITWIGGIDKKDVDAIADSSTEKVKARMYPKVYALFHRSQVEPIAMSKAA